MSAINITRKTYFALGILASGVTLAGCVLYLFGIYAALLFNIATFLSGAMVLMLGAAEGANSTQGKFCFAALALFIASLMGSQLGGLPAKLGGALAWPCFALPFWRESKPDSAQRTVSFLVMAAGVVQLVCSFLPLPSRLKGLLSLAIAGCQLALAYVLYSAEKARME
jgi:hypothetical protein